MSPQQDPLDGASRKSAPALDTPRLSLRAHGLDDYSDSTAMWTDPRVTRFIGGTPFSPPEVWSRLLRHRGHWDLLGFGYWVVRESKTQRFVGEVGFFDLKRDVQPSFEGMPESGWALAPWAQGRGYATEAVGAILAWSDASLSAARTVCAIAPENAPSIRVAERCGYVESHRADFKGESVLVFLREAKRAQ
jgi:RimJ/RimL family protein N-acetyltransferase